MDELFSGVCVCVCVCVCGFPGGSVVKKPSAITGDTGDMGSIPGSERSPGLGNGNPLQYSCLEYSMDRGAWWTAIHGVIKSQTWQSTHVRTHRHTNTHTHIGKESESSFHPFMGIYIVSISRYYKYYKSCYSTYRGLYIFSIYVIINVFVSFDKYPDMELQDHLTVLALIFLRNSILFSIVAASVYIPINSAQGFPFLLLFLFF